jgi:hypothetical protein
MLQEFLREAWIPAFAGMTKKIALQGAFLSLLDSPMMDEKANYVESSRRPASTIS